LASPQSTEILYDNSAKNELIVYVNQVRSLSDDPIFYEIVDEVKINIEYFSEKTVKDVHDELLAN
jgi:hypothetical protein